MAVKDLLYLTAFLVSFVGFILFMLAFTKSFWTEHTDGMGSIGLWSECINNKTVKPPEIVCSSSAKAEGPVWLELVRTMMILGLPLELMGTFGYFFFQGQPGKTCKDKLIHKLQEICCFLGGCLVVAAVAQYGHNYYKYYTETREYTDVELGWAFYAAAVAGGLSIYVGIIANFTKGGTKSKITENKTNTKVEKIDKNKTKTATDKPKTIEAPKPQEKEKKKENEIENEKEKKKDIKDLNGQVAVKSTALKYIVSSSHVVLAFNRLKTGLKKDEKDAPPSETRLFTPTHRNQKMKNLHDDTSSSSSSDEETTNNKNPQRQKVKRSVTTIKDNTNSRSWASVGINIEDESAKKSKPKRHMSHPPQSTAKTPDTTGNKTTNVKPLAEGIPEHGIYTIPTDLQSLPQVPPPICDAPPQNVLNSDFGILRYAYQIKA